jgi:hypothetical protein
MEGRLNTEPFVYPQTAHVRKHGPDGYADYDSYRPWLRDEFSFRCVFCLKRERWGNEAFHIDHCIPKEQREDLICDYTNLLYVCARCNLAKNDLCVPDPCRIALGQCLEVCSDGTIIGKNKEGRRVIRLLKLDDDKSVGWRKLLLGIIRSLVETNRPQFIELMRYPDDLPDLSSARRRARNSKPEGVNQSFFELRRRGLLPEVY